MTAPRTVPDFTSRRRTPVVMQTEVAECALACLAMIAGHHGQPLAIHDLRRRFPMSVKGMSLMRLIQVADALGLRARPVRAELHALGSLELPAVLHWDHKHFVVLESVSAGRGEVVLLDPAVGRRTLPLSELSDWFTGVAVEFSPGIEFREQPSPPRLSLTALVGRIRGLGSSVAVLIGMSLLLQLLALAAPLFTQWTLDRAVVSSDRGLLLVLALGFLLLAFAHAGLAWARGWLVAWLTTSVMIQWIGAIFAHLMRLPVDYFEKRHLGDVVSRMQSAKTIQLTLGRSFIEGTVDGVFALLTLAMLLYYSATLAVVTLLAVGIYFVLRLATYPRMRSLTEASIGLAARQQSHLLESIRAVQTIRISGREAARSAAQSGLLTATANRDFSLARLTVAFASGNLLLFGVERIVVIALGALAVMEGSLTIGMLVAFLAYREQFAARMNSLVDKWIEFRMLRVHSERLADIVLTAPEDVEGSGIDDDALACARLDVDVSFRYGDDEPWVLRDCRLSVGAGEFVAITGASGAGKSTLVKLLVGVLQPVQGDVRFGGRTVREVGLANYRSLLGVVLQDDQLFAGTIEENITLFDGTADPERVRRAAEEAAVHEDIARMPMAYHTLVGDMGAALSGGQKQRVLLARALYREPRILLLDEATSHLDVARERRVNDAIRRRQVTRIVVAHRPETIAQASRVLVLEGGRIGADLSASEWAASRVPAPPRQASPSPA